MKKFAVSIYARKQTDGLYIIAEHTATYVESETENEAIGYAYRYAKNKWKLIDDWTAHSVVCFEIKDDE